MGKRLTTAAVCVTVLWVKGGYAADHSLVSAVSRYAPMDLRQNGDTTIIPLPVAQRKEIASQFYYFLMMTRKNGSYHTCEGKSQADCVKNEFFEKDNPKDTSRWRFRCDIEYPMVQASYYFYFNPKRGESYIQALDMRLAPADTTMVEDVLAGAEYAFGVDGKPLTADELKKLGFMSSLDGYYWNGKERAYLYVDEARAKLTDYPKIRFRWAKVKT